MWVITFLVWGQSFKPSMDDHLALRRQMIHQQRAWWSNLRRTTSPLPDVRCPVQNAAESFMSDHNLSHVWSLQSAFQSQTSSSATQKFRTATERERRSPYRRDSVFALGMGSFSVATVHSEIFSQILFDFIRMVSHSIFPKFSGKIPYVLSKPRICFLGSKDKTVLC